MPSTLGLVLDGTAIFKNLHEITFTPQVLSFVVTSRIENISYNRFTKIRPDKRQRSAIFVGSGSSTSSPSPLGLHRSPPKRNYSTPLRASPGPLLNVVGEFRPVFCTGTVENNILFSAVDENTKRVHCVDPSPVANPFIIRLIFFFNCLRFFFFFCDNITYRYAIFIT